MQQYLDKYLNKFIEVIIDFTPKLILALVVLFVGLWLIKRVANIAEKAMTKKEMDVSLKSFLKSLISIGLKVTLFVTVAGMIGIGTTSFVTIMGAAGLAIGLALQGSLANFAGGVLILIFKPFKVDDTIEAHGQTGKVVEIQIFNTILRTFDQRTIILPNGMLSNNTIINISKAGIIRIDIPLTLSTDNDTEKVFSIIKPIVVNHPLVLKDPEPMLVLTNVANGAIHINIKPYCDYANNVDLQTSLTGEIKNALDKNNIKQFIPRA
ncbi:MAG: mechanosensitive ion channel family protein [Bacteroidia bacterium]